MKKIAALFILSFAAAAHAEGKIGQFTLVGELATACPAKLKAQSVTQLPAGFKVTPDQALALAEEAGGLKCNSIFEQQLYLDKDNYYIIKPLAGSIGVNPSAIILNGRTGEVVRGSGSESK